MQFASLPDECESDRCERMQHYARLQGYLARLTERYQTVLVLRYFEDLTYEEIAQTVGKRVGTIKSLVHRGLRRLRGIIEKEDATLF